MKLQTRFLSFLAGLAAILMLTGCVTQRAVEQAIANANVAMISPYLERPGATQGPGWRESIAEMDKLIEAHPGQEVLVNQLRLRQAMLLTVNKQDSLANARWKTIDAGSLTTERDKALYACNPAIVWAYKTLPQFGVVTAAEAAPYLGQIDAALRPVNTVETRIYLQMIRALIQLKVVNGIDPSEDPMGATELLATSLTTFVQAFPAPDQEWVRNNPTGGAELLNSIGDFRRRIWLRETIKQYLSEAKAKNCSPSWDPAWVTTIN